MTMTTPKRRTQSIEAEAKFRRRLADLGAELLEPAWLGSTTPHRVRCAAGHECNPKPISVNSGQGICRTCAGQDPQVAEAKFRARLAELGAELLEQTWQGRRHKYQVRCAAGHICYPSPDSVLQGRGPCRTCAGNDPAVAEAAFREALSKIGATLLEPVYLGRKYPHHVRCHVGHDCYPRPDGIAVGQGICRTCADRDPLLAEGAFRARLDELGATLLEPYHGALEPHRVRCAAGHLCRLRPADAQDHGICRVCAGKVWDTFYVVMHNHLPRVKFGITSSAGRSRLRQHRASGYATVIRHVTELPGTLAQDAENAVRAALAEAGDQPVQGREYFDVSCLGLILDVADSWLNQSLNGHHKEKGAGVGNEVEENISVDEDEDPFPCVRAKWTIDGATTLAEAAQKSREFADHLQGLHDEGYVLDQPIADDYGFYHKP